MLIIEAKKFLEFGPLRPDLVLLLSFADPVYRKFEESCKLIDT